MLKLQLPETTDYPASVFTANGEFVMVGHNVDCEQKAILINGLYCWNIDGTPRVRRFFDDLDSTLM